jgi:hypothetical protein
MSDLVRKSIFKATQTRNTESMIYPAVSFHPLSEAQMCPPLVWHILKGFQHFPCKERLNLIFDQNVVELGVKDSGANP